MGEVAICGGSGMEFRVGEMGVAWRLENEDTAFACAASISSSVVMWERFLPKMVMRVLLVESDYSTRHIITALLKKCGYKVVAVGDGLTAWETLRGRPSSIDLILTEVDLPSISGFALLTLIMDHEVCKNIPVIMMSSHDKVSSVYKCMSRGATDFLVKPIRKNELNNLWQHVWRKQASSNAAAIEPMNTSAFYKKYEATAESTKKSSDAQSSCTKPESGNGGDEHLHTSSQLGSPKCSDVCTEESELREDEASQLDKASGNSSIKVIDLTGASDNNLGVGVGVGAFASNACSKELDPVPQMDLLVRKPLPNHSDFSPFSRYTNKDLQLGTSRLMCNQEKDHAAISETRASDEQKYSSINGVTQTRQGESTSSYENAVNGDPWLPSDWRALKSLQVRILSNQWDISNSMDDTDNKQNQKAANMESNGTISSHYQNVCSISNSKFDITPSQSSIEDGYHVHDKDLHFHSQREAALAKFRLKRKDRCFDKKVRYESRKKLAEQRPRLKGQFVRQVGCDTRAGKVSVG